MKTWTISHRVDDKTLTALLQLDKDVYSGKDAGSFEECKRWLSVNKKIYTVLRHKGVVVGYINFFPLTDEAYNKFVSGRLKDYKLTEKDISPFVKGKDLSCLFTSIVIKQEYRDGDAIKQLLNGFTELLQKLTLQGVRICSVVQDCVSLDGIKIALNYWNADYIGESKNGKLYERNLLLPSKIHRTKLDYVEINEDNLALASKIQYEIFKGTNSVGYLDFKKAISPQNRLEKRLLPLDYLVYNGKTPIGIVGLYEIDGYPEDIWVDWLGVLPQYRNRGYGTQMLLHIFETARLYDKKYLRLYTFLKTYPEGARIYHKTMQLNEGYYNKADNARWMKNIECHVFSSSLHDKRATPWNNRFMNVNEEYIIHKKKHKSIEKRWNYLIILDNFCNLQ